MTYRERLRREQPECVDSRCIGGCKGCPGDYWTGAPNANFDPKKEDHNCSGACTACWGSEIPVSDSVAVDGVNETLLIGVNFSKDNQCLTVSKYDKARVIVLKTFYGKEAEELYLKLTQ